MAIIKIKILPTLLFLFQNLLLDIPMQYIDKIQKLTGFLWQHRKPRVKMSLLQSRGIQGGIRFSCIKKYYYDSKLVAMMSWWRGKNKYFLEIEQQGVPLPLKEWALLNLVWQVCVGKSRSTVYWAIMAIWIKCQHHLSPVQSPLASFIYHPAFHKAGSIGDFRRWEQVGLEKLGSEIKEEQVI